MSEIEITKEEMQAYENCRASGITNMWMVSVVEDYTGLNKEQIIFIMENYSALMEKFGIKRGK